MNQKLSNASASGPCVNLDSIELWVSDVERMKQVFMGVMGLRTSDAFTNRKESEEATAFVNAGVRFIVRKGLHCASPITRHVARHGDSIADVSLVCSDVGVILDLAARHNLKILNDGGIPKIDVLGDGLLVHSLRDRTSAASVTSADSSSLKAIDHVTYCLPYGALDRAVFVYRKVLGLLPVDIAECGEVGDEASGMRSLVLRSPLGFTVVLTEPLSSVSNGQTQKFLDAHGGAGVQHIAISCDDLLSTVELLRSKGMSFLPVAREDLELSRKRLSEQEMPWLELHRHGILVDADATGTLFQIFSQPLTEKSCFFIELIQRNGAIGFGANNVQALFTAVDAAMKGRHDGLWLRGSDNTVRQPAGWIKQLQQTACTHIPFYRDLHAGADCMDLRSLPSFEKSATAPYGNFPISVGGAVGAYRVNATSGTSGNRLYVSLDEKEWGRTGDWLERVGKRVGFTSKDVLINTHCYGMWVGGPALDLLANRSGAGLIPLGPANPKSVLRLLNDGIGTAISATPSYMRRLVEAAADAGFKLRESSLRIGFIGAEVAEEAFREKIRQQLPPGFVWIELYGLTETGGPSVAFAPDPAVAELELNTRDYHVEVLQLDADEPAPLGDVGELTITTRRPDGRTPLIRYRTRDLVKATAGDSSAPTRISRILGRADDSLKIGGVLVYPSAVADIVTGLLPATAEWRAWVVRKGDDDELFVEVEASSELCSVIETAFRSRIGVDLTVKSTTVGNLIRSREKTKRILIESSTIVAAPDQTLDERSSL